jgi:rubrerythrin
LQFLKHLKVRRVEKRPKDAWYDMSLRQLRTGEVNFYRAKDFLTGTWLFKLCIDKEQEKILVKAVKCPAGIRFAQLEGKTMVFQKSNIEGMLYDVISLSEVDNNNRLRRNVVSSIEEVPTIIRKNYIIKSYEEATGKKAPGKNLVTLCKRENEKEIITLFVLERAWPLSESNPEEKLKEKEEKLLKKKAAKKEVDTGQVWSCPICGKKHRLVHVETEKTVKHALRKPNEQP